MTLSEILHPHTINTKEALIRAPHWAIVAYDALTDENGYRITITRYCIFKDKETWQAVLAQLATFDMVSPTPFVYAGYRVAAAATVEVKVDIAIE